MIAIDIVEQSVADLADYGSVPISFEVRAILDLQIVDQGLWAALLCPNERSRLLM
jgi:hypothetical protein